MEVLLRKEYLVGSRAGEVRSCVGSEWPRNSIPTQTTPDQNRTGLRQVALWRQLTDMIVLACIVGSTLVHLIERRLLDVRRHSYSRSKRELDYRT